jgi:hypothetical protein
VGKGYAELNDTRITRQHTESLFTWRGYIYDIIPDSYPICWGKHREAYRLHHPDMKPGRKVNGSDKVNLRGTEDAAMI